MDRSIRKKARHDYNAARSVQGAVECSCLMHMFARLVAEISIDVEFLVSDPSWSLIMPKITADLHQCCVLNADTDVRLCCHANCLLSMLVSA